jgi:cytochrome P450
MTFPLPRGPTLPAWRQFVRFAGDPLGVLDECHDRFGDAFTLDVAGLGQFVILSDPEVVRDVFRGDPEVLSSGEANLLLIATVGRSSVLVLDGAADVCQRRVLVPPLKGERMRAFFDAMRQETLDAVRAWPIGAAYAALPPAAGRPRPTRTPTRREDRHVGPRGSMTSRRVRTPSTAGPESSPRPSHAT